MNKLALNLSVGLIVISGTAVAAMQRDWLLSGKPGAQVVVFAVCLLLGSVGGIALLRSFGRRKNN